MKKVMFLSVIAAVIVLTGCATKQPVISQVGTTKPVTVPATNNNQPTSSENVSGIGASGVSSSSQSSVQPSNQNNAISQMQQLQKKLKSIYFNFNKYNIRSNMTNTLQQDIQTLKVSDSSYTIKLEGNCDDRGSNEYNFALGLRRANTVKKSLVNAGLSASHITMISYGKTKPVCMQQAPECWQRNRRVDFKLLP